MFCWIRPEILDVILGHIPEILDVILGHILVVVNIENFSVGCSLLRSKRYLDTY